MSEVKKTIPTDQNAYIRKLEDRIRDLEYDKFLLEKRLEALDKIREAIHDAFKDW